MGSAEHHSLLQHQVLLPEDGERTPSLVLLQRSPALQTQRRTARRRIRTLGLPQVGELLFSFCFELLLAERRYYPPTTTIHGMEEQQLIYEQAENYDDPLRCPVKLFEFYLSKCPESVKCRQDVLYLLPEATCVPESPLWFSSQALSGSTMEQMLTRIKTVRDVNDIHLSMSQTSFESNHQQQGRT